MNDNQPSLTSLAVIARLRAGETQRIPVQECGRNKTRHRINQVMRRVTCRADFKVHTISDGWIIERVT